MVRRACDWMTRGVQGVHCAVAMAATVAVSVVWVMVVVKVTIVAGHDVFDVPTRGAIARLALSSHLVDFLQVLGEDALFRLFPVVALIERYGVGWKFASGMSVVSAFFGYAHGGLDNIYLQGVFGLILVVLFMKAGGSEKRYVRAFAAVSVVHYVTNLIVMALPEIPL